MEAFTLTLNISAKTLSNTTIKDSFEISSSRGFRKCPWLLDLIKIWLRYWGLKRRLPFENRQLFFGRACINTALFINMCFVLFRSYQPMLAFKVHPIQRFHYNLVKKKLDRNCTCFCWCYVHYNNMCTVILYLLHIIVSRLWDRHENLFKIGKGKEKKIF